jgi:hypothetical protein
MTMTLLTNTSKCDILRQAVAIHDKKFVLVGGMFA